MVLFYYSRPSGTLNGHFQIRGLQEVTDHLLDACEGKVDLQSYSNKKVWRLLLPCKHLTELIKDEQLRNCTHSLRVSKELSDLVQFILDAINCEVGKKPNLEMVPEGIEVVRNWEFLPANPICYRRMLFELDQKYNTQINKIMNSDSLEASKEAEKIEFKDNNIGCKNDHASKRCVTPGL